MGRIKYFAKGVRWKNGAFRYRVPRGTPEDLKEIIFSGKQEVTLGKTEQEAIVRYYDIIKKLNVNNYEISIVTMDELIDKYILEVSSAKELSTRKNEQYSAERLKAVFTGVKIKNFKSSWAFKYKEITQKKYSTERYDFKRSVNFDLTLLNLVFNQAIEWGIIENSDHPTRHLNIKYTIPARDRYAEKWELEEALKVATPFIKAYIRLKLCTGISQSDLLRIKESDLLEEGIYVQRSKTGQKTIYTWNDERREAIKECLDIRPCTSEYIFCTNKGGCYADSNKNSGFQSAWKRFMKKALEKTALENSFTEHDLRTNVASDAESAEQARKRLAHKSVTTTNKYYRIKPEKAD